MTAIFVYYNYMKCAKYETCAKLHMFQIWYISGGCTPLVSWIMNPSNNGNLNSLETKELFFCVCS